MSDVNKIVAAIISTARASVTTGSVSVEARIQDYRECLKALNELPDHGEPNGLDLNAAKAAIIETLDRVLAKR